MYYRNKKDFGEFITNNSMEDLWAACKPEWIEVTGNFKSRGGISWKTVATKSK
jgi:NADPH-dependent 7-cyano-7-deazaguanine reductase QueF